MIDRAHALPVARQARTLGISRASVYYRPRPVSATDLELMRRIDALHLEHPFAGSRMLRAMLRREGLPRGRRHIGSLMRRMGIEALYRRPATSGRHPAHPVHPYLLRGLAVTGLTYRFTCRLTPTPQGTHCTVLGAPSQGSRLKRVLGELMVRLPPTLGDTLKRFRKEVAADMERRKQGLVRSPPAGAEELAAEVRAALAGNS